MIIDQLKETIDLDQVKSVQLTELHMRYKFHPMNPNKKHTFSKPIIFI